MAEKSKDIKELRSEKSKYERVLGMSSSELIAKAIQDVLKREKENGEFRKNSKK